MPTADTQHEVTAMDQEDVRMDGARMPRAQLIEEIEYEANAVSSGIDTDFLIQRISREAIDEIEKAFAAAKDIPDRASRIAMLTSLERMASCMVRISHNDEVDYVGPRMVARSLRLSGLILLEVERKIKRCDDATLKRYWHDARQNYDLADGLYNEISRMLSAERHAEEQERWEGMLKRDDYVPPRPRRSLLDVILRRGPEVRTEPS